MDALFYLWKRSFVNWLRMIVKKPVFYIALAYCLLVVFMLVFLSYGAGQVEEIVGTDVVSSVVSPAKVMSMILVAMVYLTIPSQLEMFVKRKGMFFKAADVSLTFTSPVNPKLPIFAGYLLNVVSEIIVAVVIAAVGIFFLHLPWWRMLILMFLYGGVEILVECSLAVIVYGNEGMKDSTKRLMSFVFYGVILAFFVIGILYFWRGGLSLPALLGYIESPWIYVVPLVGWCAAVVSLVVTGATTLNVICTILYLITVFLLVVWAWKMKCAGGYYEDAMKFADTYQEARKRARAGHVFDAYKRKRKYKKAAVIYKGAYAQAIFYRQLLEYKKNRFFIFGSATFIIFLVGAAVAALLLLNGDGAMVRYGGLIFMGVMAYAILLMTGTQAKWDEEVKHPYTFLVPDTAFRKLWYSTLMEHFKGLCDGFVMVLPAVVLGGISIGTGLLCVICYVCLNAARLYASVIAEGWVGSFVGRTGRRFVRMALLSAMIMPPLALGIVMGILVGVGAGFIPMIVLLAIEVL